MAGDSDKSVWRVVHAEFEKSAAHVEQCPLPEGPEVAIAGRSNVGKSSLLNALCRRRGLARVSRTPGRTQLLNVFRLDLAGPGGLRRRLRCVDLPGYGFAATTRRVRESFAPMIERYLLERSSLCALVLLVDLRRGLGDLDLAMAEFMSARGLPTLLVATKADKVGAAARSRALRAIAQSVGAEPSDVIGTSASSGLGIHGAGGLVEALADLAAEAREDAS